VLINPGVSLSAEPIDKSLSDAAGSLGIELVFVKASTPAELDAVFAGFARDRRDALFIAGDSFFAGRIVQIVTLTARERMPASFSNRLLAEGGLLMSYGADVVDSFRQVGIYAGSIVRGTKPEDLPVLQSTKFELVINLQTAKSLGLEVPPTLLARADEVIE
jgi:putative ABC transport system substrate-binding protein